MISQYYIGLTSKTQETLVWIIFSIMLPYIYYTYVVFSVFPSNLCLNQIMPCALVLPVPPVHGHAHAHICVPITCDDNDCYDL